MAKRRVWHWVSVAFVVSAGFRMGAALAQDGTRAQAPDEAEIRTQRTANLTGSEQVREAGRIIESMSALRRRVSDMLDRARQERDIIKVNCLNDKLTQIDVTLRSAREHQDLLQTAVSINNEGQRNHEYALMTIFRQRAEGLEAEARQCVGEDASAFGEGTRITLQVNPSIPEQDTTVYPVDPTLPERPLIPSPTM